MIGDNVGTSRHNIASTAYFTRQQYPQNNQENIPFTTRHLAGSVPSARTPEAHVDISLEQIRLTADGLKEDLQRRANQAIRKKDWEQGISALASRDAIDEFVYLLEVRAGSQLVNYVPRRRGRPRKAKI